MCDKLKEAVWRVLDRMLDGERLMLVELVPANDDGTEWRLDVKMYNPASEWTHYERFYFPWLVDTESYQFHVLKAYREITMVRERAGGRNDNTDVIENMIIENAYKRVQLDSLYMRMRAAILDAIVKQAKEEI